MTELSERQVQITELLREAGFLTVDALAERYSVTTQTIRRDLNKLCEYGFARRRHGGIAKPVAEGNLTYSSRQILSRGAKRAIAREVARHIPDGSSVAFSIGTTPESVAFALMHHKRLRIFTNNLNIAMLACTNPTFEVNVAGGRVRNNDGDVLGPGMDVLMSSYIFDFGVYGVAGVDEHGTLLDFNEDEVRARQLIHDNSRTTMLVLDHSKFGRTAHVRGGEIGQTTKIFCNARPPESIVRVLNNAGSQLLICSEGETK